MTAIDEDGYKYYFTLDNLKFAKAARMVDKSNPYSIENIKLWLKNNDLTNYFSEITNIKKPAILQIDDRCINFKGDYTQTLTEIQNFKPWYKS